MQVVCGKRAGAFTCLLDETGRYGPHDSLPEDVRPDFKVSSLSEVFSVLEEHFDLAPVVSESRIWQESISYLWSNMEPSSCVLILWTSISGVSSTRNPYGLWRLCSPPKWIAVWFCHLPSKWFIVHCQPVWCISLCPLYLLVFCGTDSAFCYRQKSTLAMTGRICRSIWVIQNLLSVAIFHIHSFVHLCEFVFAHLAQWFDQISECALLLRYVCIYEPIRYEPSIITKKSNSHQNSSWLNKKLRMGIKIKERKLPRLIRPWFRW